MTNKTNADTAPAKAGIDTFTIQGEPRRAPQPLGTGATCPTSNGADLDRWEALQAQLAGALDSLQELHAQAARAEGFRNSDPVTWYCEQFAGAVATAEATLKKAGRL